MSNPAWGMKRICPNCSTRYYDFQKDPPACPVCGTLYDPEALLKSRRSRMTAVEEPVKRKKAAVPVIAADEELPELPEDDADDLDDEIEEVDMEDGDEER